MYKREGVKTGREWCLLGIWGALEGLLGVLGGREGYWEA